MFRVLIADDEAWVLALVRSSVDWENLGLELVGETASGPETYEKILELQPDIVITDIRMPGLGGIEIMEKVRLAQLRVEFIILTGYSSFAYAQAAVKYDAVRFLMKPLNEQELRQALTAAVERLRDRRAVETTGRQARSQLRELREAFLLKTLRTESGAYGMPLETINEKYDCRFRDGHFFVLITHCERLPDEGRMEEMAALSVKAFRPMANDTQCFWSERRMIAIVNTPFSPSEDYVKRAGTLLQQQITLCRPAGIRLTMGMGTVENSWATLYRSAQTARWALRAQVLQGQGRLYTWKNRETRKDNPHIRLPISRELQLTTLIETFEADEIALTVGSLVDQILLITDESEDLFLLLEQLVDIYRQTVTRMGIGGAMCLLSRQEYLQQLEQCDTMDQLKETLGRLMAEPLRNYRSGQSDQEGSISAQIKAYVARHYRENLRLMDIADALCRNPSYIGTIFKREMGLSFSEYLAAYRVNVARNYLLDTQMTVAGIAETVGFSDLRHFSKTFKKLVGLTPAAYRKKSVR